MSESEEEVSLTQTSFNDLVNPGNQLEKLLSSKNLEEDYKNAQKGNVQLSPQGRVTSLNQQC